MPPIYMPFMYVQKVFVINHDSGIVREPQEKVHAGTSGTAPLPFNSTCLHTYAYKRDR